MFPEVSMPTFTERADLIRAEFDSRAPKLRLSVFAYLVENGVIPSDIETTDDFLDLMTAVTQLVGEEVAEFASDLEGLDPQVTEIAEGENPYRDEDGRYL